MTDRPRPLLMSVDAIPGTSAVSHLAAQPADLSTRVGVTRQPGIGAPGVHLMELTAPLSPHPTRRRRGHECRLRRERAGTVFLDLHEGATAVFRHPPKHGRVSEEADDLVQRHHAGMQGFSLGSAMLPPESGALIEWSHLENRPLLRAAHGVVLCWLLERRTAA